MDEEKKDILDFFFDGDIIIAGAQGYTNISKILETGNYMFAINDCDSDLNKFFMHGITKAFNLTGQHHQHGTSCTLR